VNLKDFVSQTLTELALGVQSAQKTVSEAPGGAQPVVLIAPDGVHFDREKAGRISYDPHAVYHYGFPALVEFDVAITAAETTETGAKGGLNVKVVEVGGHRDSTVENETVSRIKFTVPVVYGPKTS
jgi:hypothetical protein